MRNGRTSTGWHHFSLSNTNGASPGAPARNSPPRHGHVTGQRPRAGVRRRAGIACRRERRLRIPEGLARPCERLVVHVLVKRGELVEVAVHRAREPGAEPLQQAVVHAPHVREGLRPRRQGQIPALVVVDCDGVVEGVGAGEERRLAVHALQDEVLVEPCDVPDLPAHRVDDAQPRPHELLVGEVVDELAGTHAGVADVRFERGRFDLLDRRDAGRNDYRELPMTKTVDPRREKALNISVITPAAKRSRSGNRVTGGALGAHPEGARAFGDGGRGVARGGTIRRRPPTVREPAPAVAQGASGRFAHPGRP